MFTITKQRSPHGGKLERWFGSETVAGLSRSMVDWYGPPIAVSGAPGSLWAHKGGDFSGPFKAGQFLNAVDFALLRLKRIAQVYGQRQRQYCGTGFASFSDLVNAAMIGWKRDVLKLSKIVVSSSADGISSTTWSGSTIPLNGQVSSAAPTGRVCNNNTLGAIGPLDNVSPDTRHFVRAEIFCGTSMGTILLYDRLYDVLKTMASIGTEAVSGTPNRYQSITVTDQDYAGGNFLFPQVTSTLSATAHNWNSCTYLDEAGNSATLPSSAGTSAAGNRQVDLIAGRWFMPLQAGDIGVKALTQIQCDASVTGGVDFVIAHPIAFIPCPLVNAVCVVDGIMTAFNLARVFDGACLSTMNVTNIGGNAVAANGFITLVHG